MSAPAGAINLQFGKSAPGYDGFAWNGQTYDSLSKVAFAITGTKWNGPRFFGFRDKEDRSTMEARS